MKHLMNFAFYYLSFVLEAMHVFRGFMTRIWSPVSTLCAADVKGYSDIVYTSAGKHFRIRFQHVLGPPLYNRITDESGKVITSRVNQFAGPGRTFYGIPTTPEMLGYKQMTVFFRRGHVARFTAKERINLVGVVS